MAVRIHEIPGLQGQQINAPQVSVQAATAPARALGDVAQGIANAGEAFGQIGERIQHATNARMESETRQKWMGGFSQLLLDLAKDSDPATYLPRVDAFLQEQKATLDQPDLAPAVRDRLVLQYDDFATKARSRIAGDAASLEQKRAGLALSNGFELAKKTGNRAAWEREKETAKTHMQLLPEQESAMDADFEESVVINDALTRADTEPDLLLQDFDVAVPEGSVDPATRRRIKDAAENNIARFRNDEMDLLDEALKAETLRPSDVAAATYLSERDRRAYLTHIERNTPPTRETLSTQWDRLDVLRRARNDSGLTPEQYRDLYYETKSGVLAAVSPAHQGEMAKELGYLSPAGRSKMMQSGPDAPVTKEDLLGIGRSMISRARSANAFGDIENGAPDVKEKAWRKAEDAELSIKRYLSTHHDATPDDIRAHADALISGTRTTAAKQTLRSMVPGSGGSLRGAIFPPVAPSKARLDGGVGAPAGQGESSDSLLPPRDDLDTFLNE